MKYQERIRRVDPALPNKRMSNFRKADTKDRLLRQQREYIENLKSPIEEIRKSATEQLKRIGGEAAIGPLLSVIKYEKEDSIKQIALDAILVVLTRIKNVDRINHVNDELEEIKKKEEVRHDAYLYNTICDTTKNLAMLLSEVMNDTQ